MSTLKGKIGLTPKLTHKIFNPCLTLDRSSWQSRWTWWQLTTESGVHSPMTLMPKNTSDDLRAMRELIPTMSPSRSQMINSYSATSGFMSQTTTTSDLKSYAPTTTINSSDTQGSAKRFSRSTSTPSGPKFDNLL